MENNNIIQKYINIGYSILKEYNIIHCKIKFKNIRRGWSSLKGNIAIPLWSSEEGKEFCLYYVIHEIIHQIIYKQYKTFKHTKEFQELEKTILKKHNIIIEYNKSYPKKLYNLKGKLLYAKIS
jgi:hypothetical protein